MFQILTLINFKMENNKFQIKLDSIDNYFKSQKKIILYLFIFFGVFTIIIIFLGYFTIISSFNKVRIIDKSGFMYNTEITDYKNTNLLQEKAFLFNFAKCMFEYTNRNINENLKKTASYGDESVSVWLNQNTQNYKNIKELKGYSHIDDNSLINTIQIKDNSFQFKAIVTISINEELQTQNLLISGFIYFGNQIDVLNPNGYFIKNLKINFINEQ